MRCALTVAAAVLCAGVAGAQAPDKELVATLSGPPLRGGIVSGVAWAGGTVIIQTVALEADGTRAAHYFVVPGPRMQLREMKDAPAGVERYWQVKASRVSPTGLGKITTDADAKMPMYGIASQEKRLLEANEMGGTRVTHELRIGALLLHRRFNAAPYDGEVWSWSPPELNRIAYVDEKGDLYIALADGRNPERVLKGNYTLPAWSDDGLALAVAERKGNGTKWEVSVIHLPEKYRR